VGLQRDTAKDAGVDQKHNALRHSFISYRVAKIKKVNEVAMEAGNSPDMIFKHYRNLVTEKEADGWFGVTPDAVAGLKKKQEAERAAMVVELPRVVAA
jgi:predicted urease superfamily metal-dependent hydrolase